MIAFNETIDQNFAESRADTYSKQINDLICADAKGSYRGSKVGFRLGKKYYNNEDKFGIEIGGVVIGAAVSYKCFLGMQTSKSTYLLNNKLETAVDRETFVAGYASERRNIQRKEYAKGISWGLDSCSTRAGILHNRVLAEVEHITLLGIQQERIRYLNPSERNLVESDDFSNEFISIVNNRNSSIDEITISDKIMDLFVEAVNKSKDNQGYIERIISYYSNIVKRTKNLSDDDKQCLYIGFAVMGYSYEYWSAVYSLEEEKIANISILNDSSFKLINYETDF